VPLVLWFRGRPRCTAVLSATTLFSGFTQLLIGIYLSVGNGKFLRMSLSRPIGTDPRRLPRVSRRLFLLSFALAALFGEASRAEQVTPSPEAALANAVRVLAHEKSAAEQYAVILATVGKADIARYVRGIQRYADAKSEFDAMIAELKFNLTTGQDPTRSAVFSAALQQAAEKRVAFTSFISHEIVDKLEGAKPGLPMVIEAAPELVKAITESGLSIWKAFRDASKERRDAILTEVDRLQWRSFEQLTKT
jgi:hypothetical protein